MRGENGKKQSRERRAQLPDGGRKERKGKMVGEKKISYCR